MLIKEKAVVSFVRNCHERTIFIVAMLMMTQARAESTFFFFLHSLHCQTLAASSLKVITNFIFCLEMDV